MANYALLDENNVVTNIIRGRDEDDLVDDVTDWEEYYGNFHNQKCKRTSINTFANTHRNDKVPFRKNHAMIGGTYSDKLDAFIPLKEHAAWVLNEETCRWESPIPRPEETSTLVYDWNDTAESWEEVHISPES
jgi:hypothetical protein